MTRPEFRLEDAAPSDAAVIRALAFRIWPAAYRDMISSAQIRYMLERMYDEDALRDQMARENHRFILALTPDDPAGFASWGMENHTLARLHKLYVASEHSGLGLGKKLVEEVMHRSAREGARELELNVNRRNPAVDFYRRMGFAIRREVDIPIGAGFEMNDYVMGISLISP